MYKQVIRFVKAIELIVIMSYRQITADSCSSYSCCLLQHFWGNHSVVENSSILWSYAACSYSLVVLCGHCGSSESRQPCMQWQHIVIIVTVFYGVLCLQWIVICDLCVCSVNRNMTLLQHIYIWVTAVFCVACCFAFNGAKSSSASCCSSKGAVFV
jgi:hypothetical protein